MTRTETTPEGDGEPRKRGRPTNAARAAAKPKPKPAKRPDPLELIRVHREDLEAWRRDLEAASRAMLGIFDEALCSLGDARRLLLEADRYAKSAVRIEGLLAPKDDKE